MLTRQEKDGYKSLPNKILGEKYGNYTAKKHKRKSETKATQTKLCEFFMFISLKYSSHSACPKHMCVFINGTIFNLNIETTRHDT